MLNTKIPINKYNKNVAPYLNMDPQFDGQSISVLWGHKHGIVPVCVDTVNGLWKICDRTKITRDALDSIEEIKADDIVLVSMADFTPHLDEGTFELQSSPYLAAATKYWFAFEGTWVPDGVNCLYTVCSNGDEGYNGECYTINGDDADPAAVWTIDGAGASLGFRIYGRLVIDGEEACMVSFVYYDPRAVYLRKAVDGSNTRFGQSFTTGASGFYVTRIVIPMNNEGNPTGLYRARLYSKIHDNGGPEVRVGPVSGDRTAGEIGPSWWDVSWTLRGTPNKILVQATGPPDNGGVLDQVGDIIEDVYENLLGGDATNDLVTADFDALKLVKTEHLGILLNSEVTFNEFIESLEVGQLFKFLPTLDRKYTVKFGANDGGPGAPWFHDEDFLSFKVKRSWKSIFGIIKLKYNEDPELQEWATEIYESIIADYIYKNTETLTLETKLVAQADAAATAAKYGSLLEYPVKTIIFEVSCGSGFSLMPMDKVKISRTRGDNTNGIFDGVLFCILEVNKNAVEGTAVITAVLDAQTY